MFKLLNKRAQTSWQLWWDSKIPKSQTCSQQRPWNPATETKLVAPRPTSESQSGCWNPKAHRECSHLSRDRKPGRNQNSAWLWRAAGILGRLHKQSFGFLGARQGLEGNPAFPKSGSLKSYPAGFSYQEHFVSKPGDSPGKCFWAGTNPSSALDTGIGRISMDTGQGIHRSSWRFRYISPNFWSKSMKSW